MEAGGQNNAPAAFPPWNENRYPLSRMMGVSHGCPERVGKFRPSPGLDLRTVQPVASRYPGAHPKSNRYKTVNIYKKISYMK
jgi:hypothetical protein